MRCFAECSGRKIWERGEPRAEPYIPCYVSRRLKGGEHSKSFFYHYYSFAERFFLLLLENLIFFISIFPRGAGVNWKNRNSLLQITSNSMI